MKSIIWSVALVACGGSGGGPTASGPIVTSMTPANGAWGTAVTIAGRDFGPAPNGGTVTFAGTTGANGFVVDAWHDTEIDGRVAFPATGALVVRTSDGEAQAGTFTTTQTWTPSAPLDVAQLLDARVLSTGDVVALYGEDELMPEPTLAVFTGPDAGAYPLADLVDAQNPGAPTIAHLAEADDHTPEVIATRPDHTVVQLAVQGSAVVSTATGLTGNVLAVARDQTGLYAWIDTGSGLVRARPGTPWTVDRGPLAMAFTALDGAVAADGTLWVTISEPAASNHAYVSLQALAPGDMQLGAPERADPDPQADLISRAQLVLAPDGVHALVLATATAGGVATPLPPRLRTAAATWTDAPATPGLVQYTFVGNTLAAIVNDGDAKTTSLVADVMTMPAAAQPIPVWPAQSQGVAVDAQGQPHPLVGYGNLSYALAPPP